MITPLMQEIVIWLLIIVSIALVAGITYVYTNRNVRVTFLFSVFSILVVILIKLISVVHVQLGEHFLGKFDTENLPYLVAKPGWTLLIHAWHIWILPVVIIALIAAIIIFGLWRYKKTGSSKIEIEAPLTLPKTQRLD